MDNVVKLVDLMEEYNEKFDKNFPTYQTNHLEDDEIIKILEECIDNNQPYRLDEDDDEVIY